MKAWVCKELEVWKRIPACLRSLKFIIHQQLIEPHGHGITVGNLCQAQNTEFHSQMSQRSLMLTSSRGGVIFSGLGGIWDGPSHGGNVCCGQTDQCSRSLLEEMDQKEHPACCQQPVPAARLCHGMELHQCSFPLLWWQHIFSRDLHPVLLHLNTC